MYVGLQRKASGLIGRFGAPAVIRRMVSPSYDPETGELSAAEAEAHCNVAMAAVDKNLVDGSEVRADDVQALVSAGDLAGFVPAPGDSLEVDGKTFRVLRVSATKPGPIAVLFKLVVRA